MSDRLIVSETLRFPYRRYKWQMLYLKAKIYKIDWAARRIEQYALSPKAYSIEEYKSLLQSYHYNGSRGVTSNDQYIFIAGQNVIYVYDHSLNLIRQLDNRYFNGLHEIKWNRDRLYVTSAVTDMIIAINENGDVLKEYRLGSNAYFTGRFGLPARDIDNRADYRLLHVCKQQYHINNVDITGEGIFACFHKIGAFVKIAPSEEIIISDPSLTGMHNAQYSPDRNYILLNDTLSYSLRVYDKDRTLQRTVDIRKLGLNVDFSRQVLFGDGHEIKAGWLRGMAFSTVDENIVFIGISPAGILAINYKTGKLEDFLMLRKNICITVHGLHNLAKKELMS